MSSLEELEGYIKDGELLKVRITDRLTTLESQYKQVADELTKLGINPNTAMDDIQKKEKEYNEAFQQLEQKLPIDIINQYKNFNFTENGTQSQSTTIAPF